MTAQEYVKSFENVNGISNEDFKKHLPEGTEVVNKFSATNAEIPGSSVTGMLERLSFRSIRLTGVKGALPSPSQESPIKRCSMVVFPAM